MSDEYYVKLTGKLLAGRSPDLAAQFLSDTFHIPMETGRTYFNGSPTVLKKKLDLDTAEKVIDRLRNTGAEAELEEVPDLGFTLELVDDSPAADLAPAPLPPPAKPEVGGLDDDFSLELVDVEPPSQDLGRMPPVAKSEPEPEPEPQPIQVEDLQFTTDEPESAMSLEMLEPVEVKPASLELEFEPAPAPASAMAPAPAPAPIQAPPPAPPPPPAQKHEEDGENLNIGDVSGEVSGGGGGVGGMLPQASTAPSFKRPGQLGQLKEESSKATANKLLLPIAGGLLVLALAAGGYFVFLAEPEPAPVAAAAPKAAPKPQPVKVDNSMFLALQQEELQARFNSLSSSISTWQDQFRDSARKAVTAEQIKTALQTDMGISEMDWQDPWGGILQLQVTETGYNLISAGPDKEAGTADDIVKEQTK
ncbi:MAG: hypothetical protein HQL47_06740 [Gammaproteobacteria bacterium]|nr:hypothetical protein [Gammaproteobacteria bacterium]